MHKPSEKSYKELEVGGKKKGRLLLVILTVALGIAVAVGGAVLLNSQTHPAVKPLEKVEKMETSKKVDTEADSSDNEYGAIKEYSSSDLKKAAEESGDSKQRAYLEKLAENPTKKVNGLPEVVRSKAETFLKGLTNGQCATAAEQVGIDAAAVGCDWYDSGQGGVLNPADIQYNNDAVEAQGYLVFSYKFGKEAGQQVSFSIKPDGSDGSATAVALQTPAE